MPVADRLSDLAIALLNSIAPDSGAEISHAPYMVENMRLGIAALDKGQFQAASAIWAWPG